VDPETREALERLERGLREVLRGDVRSLAEGIMAVAEGAR